MSYSAANPLEGCACEPEALGFSFKEVAVKAAAAKLAAAGKPVPMLPGMTAPRPPATPKQSFLYEHRRSLYLAGAAVAGVGLLMYMRRKRRR